MTEPAPPLPRGGWIEVIVGSMYSGKTEELIRRLRRAQIARQGVEIFKPAIDDRYALDAIVSHSELRIPSRAVKSAKEILRYAHEADVIGIDEGQFLGRELIGVVELLAKRGKRVIVAGLDQDYAGKPFEPMPELMAIAEYIYKALAICVICGRPANRTYRKVQRRGRVVVGGTDLYEARCRRCHELGSRARRPPAKRPRTQTATPRTAAKGAGSAKPKLNSRGGTHAATKRSRAGHSRPRTRAARVRR